MYWQHTINRKIKLYICPQCQILLIIGRRDFCQPVTTVRSRLDGRTRYNLWAKCQFSVAFLCTAFQSISCHKIHLITRRSRMHSKEISPWLTEEIKTVEFYKRDLPLITRARSRLLYFKEIFCHLQKVILKRGSTGCLVGKGQRYFSAQDSHMKWRASSWHFKNTCRLIHTDQ